MEYVIKVCENCGAKNRVFERPGSRPVCGRCSASLDGTGSGASPVAVSDGTFDSEVLGSPVPVLVDFWAPWCGPCSMVGPVLDQLAKDYAGRIKIAKINVDENPFCSARYSVRSIPTMLFFKNGRVVDTIVGAVPRATIEEKIRSVI